VHDWEIQQASGDPSQVALALVGNKHTTMVNFNSDGNIQMTEPKLPELAGILGRWYPPEVFIQVALRAGYNFFPGRWWFIACANRHPTAVCCPNLQFMLC
jgi:hypothetical protein